MYMFKVYNMIILYTHIVKHKLINTSFFSYS